MKILIIIIIHSIQILTYLEFRRNIITKNIQLNDLVGKQFKCGAIKLKVNDLCRPCKDLQNRLGKDNIIKEFLRRGGLRCEILSSGTINVGDKITLNIIFTMKQKKKKKKETQSVPRMFAKKYIYYYYGFFWLLLILFILIK